ncbi:Transposon TX1 uncharacterized 149 kDa protein [Frankliniella fusca]|uniref:Transposon TX1 uncharacterized 149 kDa protein n=1 Tax=Frankliniella fusca TaxID=407009 RepID=A0AAE1GUN0_9NEOP|nr:Transposon TX1 uncharacterized 149 kDa protein [Frankliniella fusca]
MTWVGEAGKGGGFVTSPETHPLYVDTMGSTRPPWPSPPGDPALLADSNTQQRPFFTSFLILTTAERDAMDWKENI